jgi:DNA invertase Pin-like site-specific DNA recombinase
MTKAFAYLRVSGKSQLEGDGFDRQLLTIKKYAAANGIKIVKVFREEAISGTNELDNRPALLELMEALAANGTKLVMIEKLDRLARDLMIQETIIGDLRKRGFEMISAMEPDLCSNDPSRKLMRQIFGAIAEYDRAMIVAKLKGSRDRMKAKTGRCEGIKPFGFFEGEPEILSRMQALRSDGLSFDAIAATLTSEGLPSRYAGKWQGKSVNRILSRDVA